MRDLENPFQIVHGELRDVPVSAFAIVKDEMYYLRSFLDHHRKLGVDQFIILDDQSSDGTREFLVAQHDCLVLGSPFKFGERVPEPWSGREQRAGIVFKTMIPQQFLGNRYALYLDADEYLVLPPGVGSVGALFEILARNDVQSVAANLIDFFPGSVAEMDVPRSLPTSEEMLGAHPYFDAVQLLSWHADETEPRENLENASTRLFREHKVKAVPGRMAGAPRWFNRLMPYKYPTTTVLKTPIVRWSPGVAYVNSHYANVPPARNVLLGLAHCKFTYDLSRRTNYALASKAYVRGSRKYQWYEELLDSMRRGKGSFLGPKTRRYQGPADLADAGLIQFELA